MSIFSLRDLPNLLRHNKKNFLVYFTDSGEKRIRHFSDIYIDTCKVITHLQAKDCKLEKGTCVVIMGEPSYDWLLAALACLFTGTELVALPETLTEEEATHSLTNIPFNLVIADDRLMDFSAFKKTPSMALQKISETVQNLPCAKVNDSITHHITAFTSGSTAKAKLKAFNINLDSTADFIENFTTLYNITHDDMWLVCHSFTHIVHLEYILGGLGWGYNLTLSSVYKLLMNGAALNPSVLVSVPSVYDQLLQVIHQRLEINDKHLDNNDSHSCHDISTEVESVVGNRLKVMIIGAAASSQTLQDALRRVGLPLYEGYGISECNMISSNTPMANRPGTVGRPWPNVEIKIDHENVLWVRQYVKRTDGYLNVSESENAEMFTNDGWTNTGDLCAMEDGFLKIIGRKKEIIVTANGKNINVAALEAQIQELPDIGYALVFGDQRPFLVAVLAPRAGYALPSNTLLRNQIALLNNSLPNHERIMDIVRSDEEFTTQDGQLTRSGKPRRIIIANQFKDALDACYL